VCIVSSDIFGPVKNGGIGTLYRNLAVVLAEHGHDVTLLFTQGERSDDGEFADWIAWYAERGIALVGMPPASMKLVNGEVTAAGRRSYEVHLWLAQQPEFDVVHAPDFIGLLYYSLLAKRCGLAYGNTRFVTGTHSGAWWNYEGNIQLPNEFPQLLRIVRECRQVEWSDVVISSSQHMLRWLEHRDVVLPEQTFVWPNAVGEVPTQAAGGDTIRGLAFSGRLEARKGMHLFLAALKQLPPDLVRSMPIHMLGKLPERFDLDGALEQLHEAIPDLAPPNVITDLNSDEALTFLVENRLLAIIPSILDNSPLMVTECLDWGIPLITTDIGGTAELIASSSHPGTVIGGRPDQLAAAIEAKLAEPIALSQRRVPANEIDAVWASWHAAVPQPAPAPWTAPDVADVVVCIVHHNRADEVQQALASLAGQTVLPKEIVIVDNGSTDADAVAVLQRVQETGAVGSIPARVDFQPNLYPGAARNRAVAMSDSEFLFFMDDDNIAMPQMLESFLRAAYHEGSAGAYTCVFDRFVDGTDHRIHDNLERVVPAGDVGAVGFLENAYGDTNALVRREAFDAIGGFHEIWGVGREDHSLLAQLSAGGHGVTVIPESLFWYRLAPVSIKNRHFDAMGGPSIAAMHGASLLSGTDRLLAEYGIAMHLQGGGRSGPGDRRLGRALDSLRHDLSSLEEEVDVLFKLLDRKAQR
jgi:glycosyltransferase involved in cell wall biosynthesis